MGTPATRCNAIMNGLLCELVSRRSHIDPNFLFNHAPPFCEGNRFNISHTTIKYSKITFDGTPLFAIGCLVFFTTRTHFSSRTYRYVIVEVIKRYVISQSEVKCPHSRS